jgi:hypothetical protein
LEECAEPGRPVLPVRQGWKGEKIKIKMKI